MAIENLIITHDCLESPRWTRALKNPTIIRTSDRVPVLSKSALIWVLTTVPNWKEVCLRFTQLNFRVVVMANNQSTDELKHALKIGAKGYISALSDDDVLIKAELAIKNGALWIPASLIKDLITRIDTVNTENTIDNSLSGLTPREVEIVKLIVKGLNNKVIAQKLDITERTVKSHLTNVFEKLAVKNRLQLSIKIKDSI